MNSFQKIVLASGNRKKLAELTRCLEPLNIEVLPQSDFFSEEAEETGLTFVENAIIKARFAAEKTGLPALADDSGLEVDFLSGAPGIYSSRYAGGEGDEANNQKLLAELAVAGEGQRQARFQCVLVFMRHGADPVPGIFSGSWQGQIRQSLSGSSGFGYDPLFQPDGFDITSAEMAPEQKNALSHRARAMDQFFKYMQDQQ